MKFTLKAKWYNVESDTDSDGNYSVVASMNIVPDNDVIQQFT